MTVFFYNTIQYNTIQYSTIYIYIFIYGGILKWGSRRVP